MLPHISIRAKPYSTKVAILLQNPTPHSSTRSNFLLVGRLKETSLVAYVAHEPRFLGSDSIVPCLRTLVDSFGEVEGGA